ncbi:MAG: AMP-binding protein [Acinetobacter sp.]
MYHLLNQYLHSPATLCMGADLQQISFSSFWQDVAEQAQQFQQLPQQQWALWQTDSYEFLVLFFAILVAEKTLILPPNRVVALEKQLQAEDIYFAERQPIHVFQSVKMTTLSQPFFENSQIVFFTSGSTGQPKKIPRSLQQLMYEVVGLNDSFHLPQKIMAIATVSHQHIYGLLFKLLWPLTTGRSFYRDQVQYPEMVVQIQQCLANCGFPNVLIASPALLKRWTIDIPLLHCEMVYSSGGKLESGVRTQINVPITEIFGSSETGGIAYRDEDDALWTPFADVEVHLDDNQQLMMRSPHAAELQWMLTGDRAEFSEPMTTKSQFRLLGRVDRIVKLEEKRISLDQVEQQLLTLGEIEQAHVMLIQHGQRQLLACVAVLSEKSRQQLQQTGKLSIISKLKQQLELSLERLAIPRQWRFLTQLPLNSQSKLNHHDIQLLFADMIFPVVLQQQVSNKQLQLLLEFPAELQCFKGHFPEHPIFAGVGQIGFVQHFARQYWADLKACSGYEQLKFQDLIRPYSVLQLQLKRAEHKVHFELRHAEKMIASGRLLFRFEDNT